MTQVTNAYPVYVSQGKEKNSAPVTFIWEQFHKKYLNHQSLELTLKLLI